MVMIIIIGIIILLLLVLLLLVLLLLLLLPLVFFDIVHIPGNSSSVAMLRCVAFVRALINSSFKDIQNPRIRF